jgi:hypothetical protein
MYFITCFHKKQLRFNTLPGHRFLVFPATFRMALGPTNPCIQYILETLSPELKHPRHEAEVWNACSCISKYNVFIFKVIHLVVHSKYKIMSGG